MPKSALSAPQRRPNVVVPLQILFPTTYGAQSISITPPPDCLRSLKTRYGWRQAPIPRSQSWRIRLLGVLVHHISSPLTLQLTLHTRFSQMPTTKLWQQGLDVTFWGHHKSQISDYSPLLLPPYQFEKSRHWLDIKQVPVVTEKAAPVVPVQPASGLINFFSFLDDTKRSVCFLINTAVPEFKQMVEAHIMASTVAVRDLSS
ncbi:hypothetical protein J3E69DRAFT_331849 [Trichoderma sp. SZMC 28015]